MPVDLVRDAALDVIAAVLDRGTFIGDAINRKLRRRKMAPRGRRFFSQLVYGTVRHKVLCDHVLEPLLHQGIDKLPVPILHILRMGVYQSLFLDTVTTPAMVHTSVDLAKKRGHAGTARLVNAVLKRVPHSIEDVSLPEPSEDLTAYLHLRYSMPEWLVERWREEWGDETTQAMCAAANEQAPVCVRTNTTRTSPGELVARLAKSDIVSGLDETIPGALLIAKGDALHTKAFEEGLFTIQDPASMLPAHLLEPEAGERILDLCAAPGTKSTHIAELAKGKAHVIAADLQARRLPRVHENIARLGLPGISVVAADGRTPPFAERFDRVLVDAPCSGLGTLRRHPDLKWRTRPRDIRRLAKLQAALLRSAVALCENNGVIVYAVCTIAQRETEEVVQGVLEDGNVVAEDGPGWMNPWKIAIGQYRVLPQDGSMDGFFLTRLRKSS